MENTHKMKNTPIELIPEGWSARPLGDLCEIHGRIGFRGYTKADLVRKGEGAITFSPSDIDDQRISYKDCDYISWAKYTESPEIQVKEGDILFCKTASIGKCAQIWDLKEKATINPQFVLLNDFKCNSSLLYYMLAFSSFQTRVLVITGGSTIPTISQEAMKKQLIPIPDSPEEQKRIAETLLSIDKIIGALDEAVAKKRQIKEGLMQQLLTGKVRLQGYTEDVKFLSIKKVFDSLKVAPFTREELNTVTGEYLNIHYGDILTKFHSVLNVNKDILPFVNDEAIMKCDKCSTLHDGDIVFADTAEDEVVGKACEVQGIGPNTKVVAGLHTIAFRPKDGLFAPGYLGYYLNSNNYHSQLFPFMQGIKVLSINKNAINNTIIRCPSYEEQEAIVHVLQSIDEELIGLQLKHSKYTLIKQGMMQELLTGKTRLI